MLFLIEIWPNIGREILICMVRRGVEVTLSLSRPIFLRFTIEGFLQECCVRINLFELRTYKILQKYR